MFRVLKITSIKQTNLNIIPVIYYFYNENSNANESSFYLSARDSISDWNSLSKACS